MDGEKTCKTCKYWKDFGEYQIPNSDGCTTIGECRRRSPPKMDNEPPECLKWPITYASDWCGEREDKKEKSIEHFYLWCSDYKKSKCSVRTRKYIKQIIDHYPDLTFEKLLNIAKHEYPVLDSSIRITPGRYSANKYKMVNDIICKYQEAF